MRLPDSDVYSIKRGKTAEVRRKERRNRKRTKRDESTTKERKERQEFPVLSSSLEFLMRENSFVEKTWKERKERVSL